MIEEKVSEQLYTPDTIPPCVIDAVQSLPPNEQEVITLRLGFNEPRGSVPYGEIAKRVGRLQLVIRRDERQALIKLRELIPNDMFEKLKMTLGRWFGSDPVPTPLHVA